MRVCGGEMKLSCSASLAYGLRRVRYACAAAVGEWGSGAAPLDGALLTRRREYIAAYRAVLLAEAGGPAVHRDRGLHSISATFTEDGGHFSDIGAKGG